MYLFRENSFCRFSVTRRKSLSKQNKNYYWANGGYLKIFMLPLNILKFAIFYKNSHLRISNYYCCAMVKILQLTILWENDHHVLERSPFSSVVADGSWIFLKNFLRFCIKTILSYIKIGSTVFLRQRTNFKGLEHQRFYNKKSRGSLILLILRIYSTTTSI